MRLFNAILVAVFALGPALSYAQCVPDSEDPSYSLDGEANLGANNRPDPVRLSFSDNEGATAFSLNTGIVHDAQATVSVDLATGKTAYFQSTVPFLLNSNSFASTDATWTDHVCFDLPDGVTAADIEVVLNVTGSIDCATDLYSCLWAGTFPTSLTFDGQHESVDFRNLTLLANQTTIEHQIAISATVVEGVAYPVQSYFSVVTANGGVLDFTNTIQLQFNLPEGVSFQSASGVLLSMPDTDDDGELDATDPDDDNDGIGDALDTKPLIANNECTSIDGDNATLGVQVVADLTCAAPASIDVESATQVLGPDGDLLLIAPSVGFQSGFAVETQLTVIAADPCPGCGPLPPLFDIGDTGPAGGLVFYVTNGGLHGLEAALVDLGPAEWGCEGISLLGAGGTAVGTGAQNTAAIISGCATPGIAARVADNYLLDGFDDWFLPSRFELDLMYLNLKLAGLGNLSGLYLSSSQVDADNAGAVDLDDGIAFVGAKSGSLRLRPIRAF